MSITPTRTALDATVVEVIGGRPLSGRIAVQGSKNIALHLYAAALLTDAPIALAAVPDIRRPCPAGCAAAGSPDGKTLARPTAGSSPPTAPRLNAFASCINVQPATTTDAAGATTIPRTAEPANTKEHKAHERTAPRRLR